MNKCEYVAAYKAAVEYLGLTAEEVVLSAGGALFMMGLREQADDLDLDIPEDKFRELAKSHKVTHFGTTEVIKLPGVHDVDVHVTVATGTVMVDGVCCYTPERLIAQKEKLRDMETRSALKRATDQADINKLKAYMAA